MQQLHRRVDPVCTAGVSQVCWKSLSYLPHLTRGKHLEYSASQRPRQPQTECRRDTLPSVAAERGTTDLSISRRIERARKVYGYACDSFVLSGTASTVCYLFLSSAPLSIAVAAILPGSRCREASTTPFPRRKVERNTWRSKVLTRSNRHDHQNLLGSLWPNRKAGHYPIIRKNERRPAKQVVHQTYRPTTRCIVECS